MNTAFRLLALPRETFAPLFVLTDDDLQARGIRRTVADATPGFPCRVSLADAAVGETVLLLPFTHQPSAGPYHASGPIFVREAAAQAVPNVGEIPETVRGRLLSVRAYDAEHLMVDADVCEGRLLETRIEGFLPNHGSSTCTCTTPARVVLRAGWIVPDFRNAAGRQ